MVDYFDRVHVWARSYGIILNLRRRFESRFVRLGRLGSLFPYMSLWAITHIGMTTRRSSHNRIPTLASSKGASNRNWFLRGLRGRLANWICILARFIWKCHVALKCAVVVALV
jgi:nitrate reductase gamma subunit